MNSNFSHKKIKKCSVRVNCPYSDCVAAYKFQKWLGNHIRDAHGLPNDEAQKLGEVTYTEGFRKEAERQRKDQELDVRAERNALEILHDDNDPADHSPIFHIVLLDTETTGLWEPQLAEIALLDLATQRTFQSYVKPTKLFEPTATKVNGLSHDDVRIKTAPAAAEVLLNVLQWVALLKQHPLDRFVFVAHNSDFDHKVLFRALFEAAITQPEEWTFVDSIPMLQSKKPGLHSYSLPKLKDKFLPDFQGHLHSALDDVLCLLEIFKVFYGKRDDDLYNELEEEIVGGFA